MTREKSFKAGDPVRYRNPKLLNPTPLCTQVLQADDENQVAQIAYVKGMIDYKDLETFYPEVSYDSVCFKAKIGSGYNVNDLREMLKKFDADLLSYDGGVMVVLVQEPNDIFWIGYSLNNDRRANKDAKG